MELRDDMIIIRFSRVHISYDISANRTEWKYFPEVYL